ELNYALDILHACHFALGIFQAERTAVAIRIHRMHDPNLDRALSPGVHAGEPAGKRRPAAVAMTQSYHLEVSGVHAGNLNRGFVSLGAAVGEVGLLQRAWRNLRQFL